MADDGFNGSTLTFSAAAVGKIRSISFSEDAGEVDITSVDDDTHISVGAIPRYTVNATVVGSASAVDTTTAAAALSVAFNDGTTVGDEATTWRCASKEISGQMDGEITSNLVFMPAS